MYIYPHESLKTYLFKNILQIFIISLRYKASKAFPLLSDFALTAIVPSVCCNNFHSAGKLKP